MKKLIPLVLALGCAYGTRFEANSQMERRAEQTEINGKYALIVVGSSNIGHYYGVQEGQNPFYLDGAVIKDELLQNGFKPENIYFLHGANASRRKLSEAIGELEQKVGNDDAFVAVISAHGGPFSIELEGDGRMMPAREVADLLDDVNPAVGLVYVDSCYSGGFIGEMDLDDYVKISSTESTTPAYSNAEFSGARNYLRALFDGHSDINSDGEVTFAEAFGVSNETAARYQAEHNSPMAEMASFEQQMYYGENASPYGSLGRYGEE